MMLRASPAPSVQARTSTRSARVVRVASAAADNGRVQIPNTKSLEAKTEEVKKILAKEHEHHGQGKMLLVSYDGVGKRMFAGAEVVHVGHLGGAVRSVDYSLFN